MRHRIKYSDRQKQRVNSALQKPRFMGQLKVKIKIVSLKVKVILLQAKIVPLHTKITGNSSPISYRTLLYAIFFSHL